MKTFEAFTNTATALLYEPLTRVDQWITVPPDRKNECGCKAYVGWLSGIGEKAAERYVKSGGNLIRQKQAEQIDTSRVAQVIETKKRKIKKVNHGDSL